MTKFVSRELLESQQLVTWSILRRQRLRPWSKEEIGAYKTAQLLEAPPPHRLWKHRQLVRWCMDKAMLTAVLLFGVGLFLFAKASATNYETVIGDTSLMHTVAETMGTLTLITGSALLLSLVCLSMVTLRGPAHWQVSTLEEYRSKWGENGELNDKMLPPLARQLVNYLDPKDVKVHRLIQDNFIIDPILEIDGEFVLVWNDNGDIVSPPRT